jgi:hypothetical protein
MKADRPRLRARSTTARRRRRHALTQIRMDALHMIRVSAQRNALPAKADRHAARARRRHCAAGIMHPAQPKIPRPVTPVSFELLGRQRRQHFTPCDIERGAGFLECRGRAASMPLRLLGAACAAT